MNDKVDQAAMLDEMRRSLLPGALIDQPIEQWADLPVPAQWRALLAAQHPHHQPVPVEWAIVRQQLTAVHEFLACSVMRLCLLREQDGSFALLYLFTENGAALNCYRGRTPLTGVPQRFASIWARLPPAFRDFYMRLHDGWTFLPANSMGPLPVDDWAWLSDERFDIDADAISSTGVDLRATLTVFHNGAGDYLCLHFPSDGDSPATGVIWWHEQPYEPEPVDFWGVLDAWIGLFVADADRAADLRHS